MNYDEIITWLLQGDISIQYQTFKDLLDIDDTIVRDKISKQGWGAEFLSYRQPNCHWGRAFYQPKWISTHYTLLDLRYLWIAPDNELIQQTLDIILNTLKGIDGGINPSDTLKTSDVCINGMVLNYASYFRVEEDKLKSIVDYILSSELKGGGFNCLWDRVGAEHFSLHTTISIVEGIAEYQKNNYTYRLNELLRAKAKSDEFILSHRLFKSDKTGNIIKMQFLQLSFPSRWYYDILRAMDYFRYSGIKYDNRMEDAIEVIISKRNKDGLWKLAKNHPGNLHFEMEKPGKPSRWNTLRALRVLKYYNISLD